MRRGARRGWVTPACRGLLGLWLLAAQAFAAESLDAPPAAAAPEEGSAAELVLEADPYYTDIGYNIPLTDQPIPTISSHSETEIYSRLIAGSLVPRYMVLEASVYPVPVLGTYLKSHTPGLYRQGQLGHSTVNIFESATADFQEPYAVSAFFGNVAKLRRPGDSRVGSNLGYSGYLVSASNKHIKDNVLIADNWYEVEWKIKGKIDYPDEKMIWSFRAGAKFNSNRDVVDVVYLGIHRSNTDFHVPLMNWLENSDLDVKLHFSQRGGHVVREEFVVGKKYPMPSTGYTPTLDFGLVWTSPDEYAGPLRNNSGSRLTLVFRPSVEF